LSGRCNIPTPILLFKSSVGVFIMHMRQPIQPWHLPIRPDIWPQLMNGI